ncbi:RNA-directed DNA polymerase, eukaryota, reverse transcriptase zinc-binding domain protein [Tanacetum coccineum]|uniref:RNA-directed DNA polymerase, eukaryota, reverse transcriptase zinc-binding domain protein n=1 Tax=Tanacetum coccineum TaxID=301880 RepID=A0ABQ5B6G4_9ASTR
MFFNDQMILGGDICDGYIVHRFHKLRVMFPWVNVVWPKTSSNRIPEIHKKKSYASVTHGDIRTRETRYNDMKNVKSVQLDECDLIKVEDASTVVMVKGSSAFKKVANLVGKFNFIDTEDEECMSLGRVCISTKIQSLIHEKVEVNIHGPHDSKPHGFEKCPIYNNDDVTSRAGNEDVSFSTDQVKYNHTVIHKDMAANEVVLDNSKPPSFENFIKENKACPRSSSTSRAGKCSTSFANYSKKDLKGFSFIDEMNRMIEVVGILAMTSKKHHVERVILFGDLNEVREMRREEVMALLFLVGDATIFNSFIHDTGLIDLPMGGRHFTWVNKFGSKMRKLDRFLISDDVLYSNTNLKCVETAQQILVTVSKRSRDDAESFVTASE